MIKKEIFGTLPDKRTVDLYTITNKNNASVSIQTLGGGIVRLFMPDRNGTLADVVLGFDKPEYYLDPDLGYQGLLVGRWANRIRDGRFSIDGVEYHTPQNQGTWTLHGGGRMSFNLWQVKGYDDQSITLSFLSPDMQDGFPGGMTMTVKYTLDDNNTLKLEYSVISDKKTVANPTNHSYFNLSGDPKSVVDDEYLWVNAKTATQTDESQLPTGKILDIVGTMMDFTTERTIGSRIDEPFDGIFEGVGYDNNFCLDKEPREFAKAAHLYDKQSGRKMEVWTDMPAIQVYSGGWLGKNNTVGKANGAVSYRRGVALETQFYPDCLNIDNFYMEYVEPNKPFTTTTEFRFSVE